MAALAFTTDPGRAALEYIALGFHAIPVPPRSKNPNDRTGWPDERWTAADVPTVFSNPESNIGLLVGPKGNRRIDVDNEVIEAARLWHYFLPQTDMVHGRASLPDSHPWFLVTGPDPEFLTLCDTDGTVLVELRWGNGQQALVPPSIHDETLERYEWFPAFSGLPTEIDGTELIRRVRTLGAATLLVRHYPPEGNRHAVAMPLAGFLLKQSGWDLDRVKHFVCAVATVAGDSETHDRVTAAETTAEKIHDGETVQGGPTFRGLVGDAVFDRFCEMLVITKNNNRNRTALPIIDVAAIPAEVLPPWPAAALEGDYIADLTHALTDGTPVPPQFVREEINLSICAMADQRLSYPSHPNLVARRYLAANSERAQNGKGESWERVGGRDGALRFFLDTEPVKVVNGSRVGSGQFLAKLLEENSRMLVVWDEASQLFQQAGQQNSTLLSALKTLFESNSHWSGSFTNKQHGSDDAHLSVLLQSTRKVFVQGFSVRGGIGDGLLSRFIFAYANAWPVMPEWVQRDYARERALAEKIVALIPKTISAPGIDAAARECMNEFAHEMNNPDRPFPDHTPRLLEHTKVDVLMRAVFSGSPTITLEQVERSIAWGRYQLRLRLEFWPADARDAIAAMIQTLLRRLRKGNATARELRKAANVDREGNHETFNRALSALTRSGDGEVITVGKTRKGRPVYALADVGETE
jgi:hypothetical protein